MINWTWRGFRCFHPEAFISQSSILDSSDLCHSFLRRGLLLRDIGEPLRDRRGGPQQGPALRHELLSHLPRHCRHPHHHSRWVELKFFKCNLYNLSFYCDGRKPNTDNIVCCTFYNSVLFVVQTRFWNAIKWIILLFVKHKTGIFGFLFSIFLAAFGDDDIRYLWLMITTVWNIILPGPKSEDKMVFASLVKQERSYSLICVTMSCLVFLDSLVFLDEAHGHHCNSFLFSGKNKKSITAMFLIQHSKHTINTKECPPNRYSID